MTAMSALPTALSLPGVSAIPAAIGATDAGAFAAMVSGLPTLDLRGTAPMASIPVPAPPAVTVTTPAEAARLAGLPLLVQPAMRGEVAPVAPLEITPVSAPVAPLVTMRAATTPVARPAILTTPESLAPTLPQLAPSPSAARAAQIMHAPLPMPPALLATETAPPVPEIASPAPLPDAALTIISSTASAAPKPQVLVPAIATPETTATPEALIAPKAPAAPDTVQTPAAPRIVMPVEAPVKAPVTPIALAPTPEAEAAPRETETSLDSPKERVEAQDANTPMPIFVIDPSIPTPAAPLPAEAVVMVAPTMPPPPAPARTAKSNSESVTRASTSLRQPDPMLASLASLVDELAPISVDPKLAGDTAGASAIDFASLLSPAASTPAPADTRAAPIEISTAPAAPADPVRRELDLARGDLWLDQLTKDIVAMADRPDRLSFKLQPEHLGPLDIDVTTAANGISIRMNTQNEEARSAIAAAQPRLVDDIRAQGIRVADAQVFSGNADQQRSHQSPDPRAALIEIAPQKDSIAADEGETPANGRFA